MGLMDELVSSLVVILVVESAQFLLMFIYIYITSSPEEQNVEENVETPNWVLEVVRFLAAFIGVVTIGVGSVFIFHLHDVAKCDKYVCPKARFLGPNDTNPYANHTVDFYRCEEQRYLLKSTWRAIVCFGAFVLSILGAMSMIVASITSPKAIKIMKALYVITVLYYTSFVYKFQENFESISDIMSYIRSAFIIIVFVVILFFISANSETQARLRQMMSIMFIIVGIVLVVHVGYNGVHLVCGKGTTLLPLYLFAHGFAVFFQSMFHREILPPHLALGMSLFIMPPVCPFVIALTAWSFDALWKDFAAMGRNPEVTTEPPTYGIPVDENYFHVEQHRNLRSRRRTRRARSVRGLY